MSTPPTSRLRINHGFAIKRAFLISSSWVVVASLLVLLEAHWVIRMNHHVRTTSDFFMDICWTAVVGRRKPRCSLKKYNDDVRWVAQPTTPLYCRRAATDGQQETEA
jgi:hypothetical protein